MNDLISSHREPRAVIRLSGRLIQKRLSADPNAQKLMRLMKGKLKESRSVEAEAKDRREGRSIRKERHVLSGSRAVINRRKQPVYRGSQKEIGVKPEKL